jgi:hypothetical protein
MALILGLCYIAYLFAIDYAIRRDARGEVEKWIGSLNTGGEEGTSAAFYRMLPPGARQGVGGPTDTGTMKLRFRDELMMFRESDLMKVALRNKGEVAFAPAGVSWAYKPGSIECTVTGSVTCPEGTFPVVVPLKAVEGVKGPEGGDRRQWMIDRPRGGAFIDQSRVTRTPYGWLVVALEDGGNKFGREFVGHAAGGPVTHAYAYRAFVAEGGDTRGWAEVARDPQQILQFLFAAPARAAGDAGYAEYMDKHFYKLPGGAEPQPDQKSRFFNSWNLQSLRPAGDKFKTTEGTPTDKESVAVTEGAVEVRVPAEIPIPGTTNSARARVVVVCTDPALLAEVKRLRAEANPGQGTDRPPAEVVELARKATWRVARVESDMAPVNTAQPGRGGPGGADASGMPGG